MDSWIAAKRDKTWIPGLPPSGINAWSGYADPALIRRTAFHPTLTIASKQGKK